MRKKLVLFGLTALALVALVASCRSTTTGNEGNLTFSYVADDMLLDFNKPIGVGALLDLRVAPAGTGGGTVTLTSVTTDDEAVLTVRSFEGNTVTVEGVGSGNVLIMAEAMLSDGTIVMDEVNMNVRVPEVQRLAHTCGPSGGAYLNGSQIYVPFELEMSNGRPVIGYGLYPVTSSDEALLARDSTWMGVQFMRFDVLGAGMATLSSDVDDTTLDFTLVEEAQIDGVADPIAFVIEDIDVGDMNPFYVLPTVGGTTVCQAQASVSFMSDTPETCDVRSSSAPAGAGDGSEHEHGWFIVEGIAAGECMYTVTYSNGADGAGVSAQFTYTIEP